MSGFFTVGVVCTRGVGPERGGRAQNEDNYLVCRNGQARWRQGDREEITAIPGEGVMVAVADGMGGHAHGDLASSAAVQAISRLYRRGVPPDPEAALHSFVHQTHQRLRRRLEEHGPVNTGTTLTIAWLVGARAWWVHVGDSRLYHYRAGSLRRLTRDQTRREFAERDGRELRIDQDFLVQNFVFGSRGMGHDEELRIDPGTDTGSLDLQPGDRLILCSDGLTGVVPDHRIRDAVMEAPEPSACASWLVERAMAAGTDDNITVLVIRVDRIGPGPEAEGRYTLWDDPLLGGDDGDP